MSFTYLEWHSFIKHPYKSATTHTTIFAWCTHKVTRKNLFVACGVDCIWQQHKVFNSLCVYSAPIDCCHSWDWTVFFYFCCHLFLVLSIAKASSATCRRISILYAILLLSAAGIFPYQFILMASMPTFPDIHIEC